VTPDRNDRFLRACRGEPVDCTPVWFMRQAGRYLPEYRELRGDADILTACRRPEVAVEATLQPLRRMDLDAAILFSDIMVPIAGAGVDVRIESGAGPIVAEPLRSRSDVERLRPLEPEVDVPYVIEAVRLLRPELSVPLIGFGGAPFTLASYLVEGGASRNHERTKALMLGEPATWGALMESLAGIVRSYVRCQIEAGVDAIQLFDSWAGALSPDDYERYVAPATKTIFDEVARLGVPGLHFGVGTGELLALMRRAGGDVIGVDWRTPLDIAWERIGVDARIQGNLDPAACLGPWDVVEAKAIDVLEAADGRRGHIFNLGHGVLPGTPPETLERLVDFVHRRSTRADAIDIDGASRAIG
jgi:uroporphyrinogen decarboxylase